MQISAANLLLAAQQTARQPQPRAAAEVPASRAEKAKEALFAPLEFKQASPAPAVAPRQQTPLQKPGTHLDIRI